MGKQLNWTKDKLKRQQRQLVAFSPEQRQQYARRQRWDNETWQAERARLQALADAAAPKTE